MSLDRRALQALDEMIAQQERVGGALEGACGIRTRNERHVRPSPECNYDVIVRKDQVASFRQRNANVAIRYVDPFHGPLYESHPPKAWTNWLGAVTQLQDSGACLEEQGTEQEEIVSADQRDFDIRSVTEHAIEVSRRGQSAHAATENDDPRRRSASRI